MKELKKQLNDGIKEVAKPYLDQIQKLEKQAANKRGSIESLQAEINSKKADLQKHNEQSGQLLAQGKDPGPALQEAARLSAEIETLEGFVSEHGQPDYEEQEKIEQLRDEMFSAVHNRITGSKTFQAQATALLESLRGTVEIIESWDQAVKGVCADLGVGSKNHKLLEFKDESEEKQLAGKIGILSSKYAHLFNKTVR